MPAPRDPRELGPAARSQEATRERVRLLLELSRPREAVEQARRARAQGDQSPELDELEALALVRMEDPKAALEVIHRGLRTAPARAHLHYLRSFAARSAGQMPEAREAILTALAYAPEEPVYLRAQAELLSELKEHAPAIAAGEAAVRAGPDRAANFVTLGFVVSAAGDKTRARGCYEQALLLDPEDAAAWNNLGCLDLDAGDPLTARERFREALRLWPEGPRARRNLEQTLTGRTLEGFVGFSEVVQALAKELALAEAARELLALSFEAEEARPQLAALLTKSQRGSRNLTLGMFSVGALVGLLLRGGPLGWATAGVGIAASMSAKRWLGEERLRVRDELMRMKTAYEGVRADWLAGRLERAARDAAARRLIERAALVLCHKEVPEMKP